MDSDTLLLLDSGGQYDCGTTDVTRTMHFGTPTEHQKTCFTRVLQVSESGHAGRGPQVLPREVHTWIRTENECKEKSVLLSNHSGSPQQRSSRGGSEHDTQNIPRWPLGTLVQVNAA